MIPAPAATMTPDELRQAITRIERWIPILWTAGEIGLALEHHDLAQRLAVQIEQKEQVA